MKRTLVLTLLLATSLSAHPSSAATRSVTRYYEAGLSLNERYRRTDPTCSGNQRPCPASRDGRLEVGGVVFDPIGGRRRTYKVTLRVWDDYSPLGKISVGACDDRNRSTGCDTEEPRSYKCVTPGQRFYLYNVRKTSHVVVTVGTYSCTQYINDIPEDQGSGLGGKVTMSWTT